MSCRRIERFLSYCYYRLLLDIEEGTSPARLKNPFSSYPTLLSCFFLPSGSERTYYSNQFIQPGVSQVLRGVLSC